MDISSKKLKGRMAQEAFPYAPKKQA